MITAERIQEIAREIADLKKELSPIKGEIKLLNTCRAALSLYGKSKAIEWLEGDLDRQYADKKEADEARQKEIDRQIALGYKGSKVSSKLFPNIKITEQAIDRIKSGVTIDVLNDMLVKETNAFSRVMKRIDGLKNRRAIEAES